MGLKITQYPNTQTTFNDADELDVSAYVAPSVPFESRKFTWAGLKAALITAFGQIFPSGINGQIMKHNGSAWVATSEVFIQSSGSKVGIGTTSPQSKLHVQDVATPNVARQAYFVNPINTGTTNRGQYIQVGNAYFGSVSDLGYANGYGAISDTFIFNEPTADSNVNIISTSKNTIDYKGHICFYPDAGTTPPTNGIQPPLQLNKESALLWKEMISNGFAHNEGFKITNVDTASHGTTGEYIEVQIKGVTRYIELFS